MTDKLYNSCGAMFPLHYQGDLFVTYNGVTWVLNEERWFNFCQEMANRGVNMMRWLGWNVWAWALGAKNLGPFLMDVSGKYNLSVWNETYWQIAERMIQIMNYPSQKQGNTAPGITLDMDLFYQYTNDTDDQAGSPFRNNTIGTKSLYDEANWPFAEAYAMRWFALRNKGLKIEFGMGNELGGESLDFCGKLLRLMDLQRAWPFTWAICPQVPLVDDDVFKELYKPIRNEGLFMWYPIRTNKEDRWDSSIKRPVHNVGDMRGGVDVLTHVMSNWAGLPIGIFLRDDGCMGLNGKPGADQWYQMTKKICQWPNALTVPWGGVDLPLIGIEHLPDDEQWDVSREKQLLVFDAIARGITESGFSLANFGQWPDAWVEPVIVVPPVTEPATETTPVPALCSFWYHIGKGNFKAAWEHLMGKHK